MNNNIRNSGIGIVGNIPWGAHFCQFYQTKEDLIEIVIPYFKAGLENNELCILVTSESLEVEDTKRSLEEVVPDFNACLKRGQIEIIPYANWFLEEGIFNSERVLTGYLKMLNQAIANGYNGLRVVEDTSWLGKEYWNYFADYEEKLDFLISSHQMIVLHPYCLGIINGIETIDLISRHQKSLIKEKGKWKCIENPMQKDGTECKLAEEALDQAYKKIQAQSEELKETIKELRESEERLQIIVTNSPDIIFEQDRNLRFTWIYNPVSPLTASDVIGKTDSDVFPPDQAKLLTSIKRRVLEKGIREETVLHLSPGGECRWYEAIYEPRFNDAGKVIGLVSYSRDITKRKKVEDALRKSEEQYRILFTNMHEGFVLVEAIYNENGKPCDYRYLDINPAYELNLGIKREQALGKPILEVFPNINPMVIKKLGEVAISGQSTNFEIFSQAVNKYFDIDMFSPERGKIASIFRDITGRKKAEEALQESEEQYRAFFENSIDAVLLTSPDGTVYAANPAASRIFGMTEEEIIRAGRNGTVDLSDPRLLFALEERATTGKFKGELNYRRKDGTIFPGEVSTSFFKDKKGLVKTATIIRDITKRKKAEEALRKSEERYRTLFTNMTEGFVLAEMVYDKDGKPHDYRYLEINPAFELQSGIKKERMLGKSVLEMIHNADPIQMQKLGEVALSGQSTHLEFFSQAVGKCFDIYIFSPEKGKIAAIFRDITKRKKAEAKLKETLDNLEYLIQERTADLEKAYNLLKENEKSLAEAQRMAHLGNWKWDIRTDEIHCSDEVYRIFGLKPQFRETFDNYFNYVHPDDRDIIVNTAKEVLKGKPASIDNRIIKANGEERIIHTDAEIIFDENNIPVYAKGIVQDITERRQAEKALRRSEECFRVALKGSSVVMFSQNYDLRYTWVYNPSPGLKVEEVLGKSDYEIYQPEDAKAFVAIKRKVLESGIGRRDEVVTHRPPSAGGNLFHEMTTEPLHDATGVIVGVICVAVDITERKQAEEALEKIEIARKKEIHHRIKNNLQVISSLLDLQAEQFRDKECIQDSEVLEAFRESQDRVISMALIHEELYKGGGFETLNFSPYIQELAENLFQTYRLGDTDISLKLDLAENTFFDMDIAVPLGMIVNELVSNSLKHAFIGRDEGEIRIELCREESTGFECEDCWSTSFILTIYDNGMGFPELEIEDIDSLGLQLVTSLVDQLDGELELKRNNGTEFIIRFTVKER